MHGYSVLAGTPWDPDPYSAEYLVAEIRDGLRTHDGAHCKAFNLDEVQSAKALLTSEERKRVSFEWTFGAPCQSALKEGNRG